MKSKSENTLTPLTPEASTRRYFRDTVHKKILCKYNEAILPNNDFLVIQKALKKKGIRVPEILQLDLEKGEIWLEDLGLTDFLTSYKNSIKKELKNASVKPVLKTLDKNTPSIDLLEKAICLLVQLHNIDPFSPIKERYFDFEKLFSETESTFFYMEKYGGKGISAHDFSLAKDSMRGILHFLSSEKKWVLTHRDFHSRNIMHCSNNELVLIDFQDARLGSRWYDLASFVYDPYAMYLGHVREKMVQMYCTKAGVKFNENRFNEAAVQRLHKALGTFFKFGIEKKIQKFRDSIRPCLSLLIEITRQKYPHLHSLYQKISSSFS